VLNGFLFSKCSVWFRAIADSFKLLSRPKISWLVMMGVAEPGFMIGVTVLFCFMLA